MIKEKEEKNPNKQAKEKKRRKDIPMGRRDNKKIEKRENTYI